MLSPYGGSKLATEGYTPAWGASYGLPVLAFRFLNVFGPMQPAGHVYATIADALARHVTSDEPVNLAFGSRISLLDTLELLEGIVGHPVERHHIENRKGDAPHSQADNARLRALLPDIEPEPFAEGLRNTVGWMRSEHARSSS